MKLPNSNFIAPTEIVAQILSDLQEAVTDSEAQIVEEAAVAAGYYLKCPLCNWVEINNEPAMTNCPACGARYKE